MVEIVKSLPAMPKTWVQSLGWEDSLEKEMTPVLLPGESHGLKNPHSVAIPETHLRPGI